MDLLGKVRKDTYLVKFLNRFQKVVSDLAFIMHLEDKISAHCFFFWPIFF